ncbi:MAG: helix-turn-helix domain-containing protein [Oscillospiraceae bacterium]|nr:helix-turn-helix domain-containing protein [Oscillospiraceae bacterium]
MDVAAAAGITQGYYSNIERDAKTPSPELAKRLGKVLGVDWTKFYPDEPA